MDNKIVSSWCFEYEIMPNYEYMVMVMLGALELHFWYCNQWTLKVLLSLV